MRRKESPPSAENEKRFKPVFRQASDGLWLSILVPGALICSAKNIDRISSTYFTVSVIGVGLLLFSLYTIAISKWSSLAKSSSTVTNYLLSSAIPFLILTVVQNNDLLYSLSVSFLSIATYSYAFKTLICSCPKSFTYGEAAIVSQSLILYLVFFILNTISVHSDRSNTCGEIATYILQAGYFTVFITVVLAYYYRERMRKPWIFAITVGALFLTFAVYLPHLILRRNSLLWVLELMTDQISIGLIMYWILCCVFCIYCLWKQASLNIPASSASRKNFHFVILFVLVPGLIFRPCLMYLASGVGFAVLMMVEVIRKLQLSEFSKMLQSCFDVFKDTKDEGALALTPLYLMLGCVSPFWIYPHSFERGSIIPLPVLSGILSIAIGDTAASICGTSFGKHRWPGTHKTVEGTMGCIVSQGLILFLFEICGIVQTLDTLAICKSIFVIIATSVVEATTDQIDNLVLPLVSYVFFMLLF